ncbi:MAG: phosphoribosylformylglycinamidine synthase subunit PurL [Myxococcota bacterium]
MVAPTSPVHCLVVTFHRAEDPRAHGLLSSAHALGFTGITQVECADLYFLEGALTSQDQQRLARELLSDPVAQRAEWRMGKAAASGAGVHLVETALRPGVTDPVAEQIIRSSRMLGIASVTAASTGQRFVLRGAIDEKQLQRLTRALLANPVIQRWSFGEIDPVFPHPAEASGKVETIPVRELSDDGLLALSKQRRAALDLAEMKAIQGFYRSVGRDPTDVELETIAQTWSEHCVHKTFRARISVTGPDGASSEVDGLLRTFIRAPTEKIAAPWVRSAFVDNAGIIDFDDENEVSFKVETHNHPSAIEPFGGANTGVGGVIRDVLGVSAKPIAATDVLCFGPQETPPQGLPEGVLHPRRIQSGVVAGVQDYGNKIGIPTVNGAILYDEGYTSNPLVYCGCVGIAPKGSHPRQPQKGDRVIVLGGRTGRDGLRGATFSSMTMDAQTGEVAGASVQIGDPIVEKGLIEVCTRARDRKLYHAITDCGAGGLSSAVGEMAAGVGADVELFKVRLKYPGLAPWEIWLSEAQERMVLAVPDVAPLQALCDLYDVELTDIGAFTGDGKLVVRYQGRPVLDLPTDFMHDGIPRRHLKAEIVTPVRSAAPAPRVDDVGRTTLKLLAHPNIASKAPVIRIYDHEVQGGTVVKPLTGAVNDGPSDACVLKPMGTKGLRGIVLSNGVNPQFGKRDAYRMALSVVDEALRNAVAVGADPTRVAILDNFCWGDPLRPQTLGALVEAARGCRDAALHFGTPFISGKDSLNNEYLGADGQRHAIPPTLLISAMGVIDDVTQAVTMDLKEAGNVVYLLGETRAELGGSHLGLVLGRDIGGVVPDQVEFAPALFKALHVAIRAGVVRACHDLSEGGLAVAAAEMAIAGRLGLELTLDVDDVVTALFSESNARFLVEVRSKDTAAFESHLAALGPRRYTRLGSVVATPALSIKNRTETLCALPVQELVAAWNTLP